MEMDTGMPGGIQQNQEYTDVRSVPRALQSKIGACILHKIPDGSKKPIAHASCSLLPSEKHYSQIKKEALAIIFAVTKFHCYLHGRFFKLQTDHKSLLTIFGLKKGLPIYTANRLLRWGTILLNYNFKLEYLPSRQIGHADGLSRLVPSQSEPLEDPVIASLRTDCEIKNMMLNTIRELPVTLQEIKCEAQEDEFISTTKQKIVDKNQQTVDIFSCKRPTTGVAITFLHELFARFGVVDCLVDCFVDTLKRALKKASGTPSEKTLQQFLLVYWITLNPNIPDATSPADTMFAQKIWPVFEKLLPKQASLCRTMTVPTKRYNSGDKVFFKAYCNNTLFPVPKTIDKRIGNMTYIILGPYRHSWTKSGGDGWMTLAAHPKMRKRLLKRCTIRFISNLQKQP